MLNRIQPQLRSTCLSIVDQGQPPSSEGAKTKVLFFIPSLGNGGAEMHVLRVINFLNRSKFKLMLALGQMGGSYESALAKDVSVYSLNPTGIRSSTMRMLRAIAPLRKLIETEQPDILYVALNHASFAAILACRNLKKRPKLVIGVQNPPLSEYHRHWHPVDRLIRWLISHWYTKADAIIALSKGVAAEIKGLVAGSDRITEVIYNAGVDANVLAWAKEPLASNLFPQTAPLLVACGRLHEQKGFPCLLDALVQVRKVIPAHLWIVGEGGERKALEKQIQQLGLTDCVRLVGFQKNPYQYMAAADIFVLSSLYEGFGNVIVEAMACGAPVIATDCPYGPAEIIEDGVSGLLVPPADAEALSQAIIRLCTDPDLKQRLIQQGQRRSQDFQAAAIAAAYADSFLAVLAHASSP
jgi:glycosyltransferase involved in cell wall biosynthesis